MICGMRIWLISVPLNDVSLLDRSDSTCLACFFLEGRATSTLALETVRLMPFLGRVEAPGESLEDGYQANALVSGMGSAPGGAGV